jgi:hypothetical protein
VLHRSTTRVLGLLCVMYFITYMDRVNVSTAAIQFGKEFHLSNTQIGLVDDLLPHLGGRDRAYRSRHRSYVDAGCSRLAWLGRGRNLSHRDASDVQLDRD